MASSQPSPQIRGFSGGGHNDWERDRYEADDEWYLPRESFERSAVYQRWRDRIVRTDNDLVVVVSAASKSAVSGVGKTTLAIELARYFDNSDAGFDASRKATLDGETFAQDLLADPEAVDNQSALVFDESQGTLSGDGADARRSMANSVKAITTAIATLRFRQFSTIIVSQSLDWVDKRIRDLTDILVLIQPSRHGRIDAYCYDTYRNDFADGKEYNERIDRIQWPRLPDDDPDYQYLHDLKERSATQAIEEGQSDDGPGELPKERQKEIAQELRNQGLTVREVADTEFITYSRGWVSDNTEPTTDDGS